MKLSSFRELKETATHRKMEQNQKRDQGASQDELTKDGTSSNH